MVSEHTDSHQTERFELSEHFQKKSCSGDDSDKLKPFSQVFLTTSLGLTKLSTPQKKVTSTDILGLNPPPLVRDLGQTRGGFNSYPKSGRKSLRILQYPYQNTTKIFGRFAAGTNKGGFNSWISVDALKLIRSKCGKSGEGFYYFETSRFEKW